MTNRQCIPELTFYNAFISLCFAIVFILSLLGNSIVVFIIIKLQRSTSQSITNMLLLNLAIADLLRSIICIPPTLVSEISQCWLLGPQVCKFAAYLQRRILSSILAVTVCASAYTLALIALERYCAICRPLESMIWLSKRRLLALILFVWLTAFGCNIGALVIYDAIQYETHWSCHSTATPLADFLYQIHITVLLLFIPLTIMLLAYRKVIHTLHPKAENYHRNYTKCYQIKRKRLFSNWFQPTFIDQQNKQSSVTYDTWVNDSKQKGIIKSVTHDLSSQEAYRCNAQSIILSSSKNTPQLQTSVSDTTGNNFKYGYTLRSNRQEKITEAKRRVIRMLIIIVIVFVICWTPSFIWWLTVRTSDLVQIHIWNRRANTYITLLTHISACTNPITYCFMNERFRKNITAYFWAPFRKPFRKKSQTTEYRLREVKFITPDNLFNNPNTWREQLQ